MIVEPMAREALALAERSGDLRSEHFAHHFLADCPLIRGDCAGALPRYRRALELAVELGDRSETAVEMQGVAMAMAGCGHPARALRLGGAAAAEFDALAIDLSGIVFWSALLERYLGRARAAEFHRDSGNEWGVQIAMSNAAFAEGGLGRFDSAIVQLRTALDALRRINAPYGVGKALQFLVFAHASRGDRDEALANGRAAVPYAQRGHNVAWMLLFIALVHARHGAHERAASLVAYFDDDSARRGYIPQPMLARVRDEILARTRAALGPVEFDRQTAIGATLTEERALALAFD